MENDDLVMEKIKNLHECVDRVERSFSEFKVGIGATVQDHDRRIGQIESQLAMLMKVAWLIAGGAVVIVVTSILKLVIKSPL